METIRHIVRFRSENLLRGRSVYFWLIVFLSETPLLLLSVSAKVSSLAHHIRGVGGHSRHYIFVYFLGTLLLAANDYVLSVRNEVVLGPSSRLAVLFLHR